MKAAKVCLTIGASAPPAMASSASPDSIIPQARMTASNPEGQAEETVAALACRPMRSAIRLATAWGARAPTAVGDAGSRAAAFAIADRTLDNIHRACAHADDDRRRTGERRLVNCQPRVANSHHTCRVCELRMSCHSLGLLLRLDVVERIEILHFTRDTALELGGIEVRDRPIPLRPWSSESQKASSPIPLGASTPMPVITTRFRLCT